MTKDEFVNLNVGDIVYHRSDSVFTYVVTNNYGDRVTAVRTVDLTNPAEWEVCAKARLQVFRRAISEGEF